MNAVFFFKLESSDAESLKMPRSTGTEVINLFLHPRLVYSSLGDDVSFHGVLSLRTTRLR